jgi:hypothetical protein
MSKLIFTVAGPARRWGWRLSSIMARVAARLDAQGGLDTHSLCKLNTLRRTLQHKSGPA